VQCQLAEKSIQQLEVIANNVAITFVNSLTPIFRGGSRHVR